MDPEPEAQPEAKPDGVTRRRFLCGALTGTAGLAAVIQGGRAQAQAGADTSTTATAAAAAPVPAEALLKRKLGKTGAEVTILNLGGMMPALSPEYLEIAYNMGVRYFDTADCYLRGNSEKIVGRWVNAHPERRKDLFIVTKDHPRNGFAELPAMLDRRLANLNIDHVDSFFIHGLGPREYGQESLDWVKNAEFKAVCEQMRKSGKTRFVGFSCHDALAAQYLANAAEGGFIDHIMVAYDPFLGPTDELKRSIDACDKAGIGMTAMKVQRAHGAVPAKLPELEAAGLTTRQGLLQAVWSDERIATICSSIENLAQMTENVEAARKYKGPLTTAQMGALRETVVACRPSLCPNCDGRCSHAAGNAALALNDIARYVNYYERDGNTEGREWYRAMAAAARDAGTADLAAASRACLAGLDHAAIALKAERYFA